MGDFKDVFGAGADAAEMTCHAIFPPVTTRVRPKVLNTECSDPTDFETPMNCAMCSGYYTVIQHHDTFICTECLATSDSAPLCKCCNERQIGSGDLEYSYLSGCEFCDGQAGWTKDD